MTDNAVSRAGRLVAQGAVREGVGLLAQAGDGGDVDALMQLAVWHLVGDPVPRDLPRARALLRRAVEIGHVDAALMEIALVANGSGAAADWPAALSLLHVAAAGDPVAAAQLALVQAMRLDAQGRPADAATPEVVSASPRIVRFPRFLTPAECAHVAGAAAELLVPAQVVDPRTGRWTAHPIRSSDDAAIGPTREDLVVRAINLRVAAASATAVERGEPLTVLRYRPGQQYRPHLDTIQGAANQRSQTMLIYLNEGYGGGETDFPAAGVRVTPRGGDAVLFDTLDANAAPDLRTRHAGLPVQAGVKWLATRWIRAAPVDPWTLSTEAG